METLKKSRTLFLLSVAILLAGIMVWQQYAQAKKRTINYFPQEYSLDMIESDYKANGQNLLLGETTCSSDNVARDYDICLTCEQLRKGCPDCCFDNKDPKNNDIACKPGCTNCGGVCSGPDMPDGIPPAPLSMDKNQCDGEAPINPKSADTCADWGTHISQWPTKKLCPETVQPKIIGSCPKIANAEKGPWYCTAQNALQPLPACPYKKKGEAVGKKCKDVAGGPYTCSPMPVVLVDDLDQEGNKVGSHYESECGNVSTCFKCDLNPAFEECVNSCKTDAETWESCSQKKVCCTEDSCGTETDKVTGKLKLKNQCPKALCDDRKKAETGVCANRDSAFCQKKISDYNDWIADGRAVSCFKPLDEKFKYTFVGKKHEAVTFIWQVFCEPQKKEGQNILDKKFYTILKIYEVKNPAGRATYSESDLVFFSMIHQKDFNSEFALNAATRFEPEESGKVYNAVVCYFIPPVDNADLQMKINDQQIFALRNRE